MLHSPEGDFGSRMHTELVSDPFDVAFGRPLGDEQALGDLPVGEAGTNQSRHLLLPPTQWPGAPRLFGFVHADNAAGEGERLPAFLDNRHAAWLQADESTMYVRAVDKIPPRLLDRNIHGHFPMVEHEEDRLSLAGSANDLNPARHGRAISHADGR